MTFSSQTDNEIRISGTIGLQARNSLVSEGCVNPDKLAANSVVAGKVAAGAISAAEIAAGAIVASKIAIYDLTNLVINNWTSGDLDGWTYAIGSAWAFYSGAPNGQWTSAGIEGPGLRIDNSNGWLRSGEITVSADEIYYAEIYTYRSTSLGAVAGQTALQVIPLPAVSSATVLVNPTRPCLAAT